MENKINELKIGHKENKNEIYELKNIVNSQKK